MSGLRFKVGEMAIFAVAAHAIGIPLMGTVVEVTKAGRLFGIDGPGDYEVLSHNAKRGLCFDWQLRKLDRPAEPASLTRESEVVA